MARSGLVGRAVDYAEDRLGFRMVEGSHYEALEEASEKLGFFIDEAGELAYSTLDYFSGRPNEMRPERRNRLAARSRRALREDPLAKAETDLVANFAFGRGVAKPTASDEKVQELIDEAWMDPINRTKLTGFEAQRHRSAELKTQANLYPAAFVKNGRVRVAFLDADLVHDVVCDADDDELPLYYVGRKKKVSWNFETHQYEVDERLAEGGVPKTIYYAHWRNVEDRVREAGDDGEKLPEGPEKTDLAEGLVEHVRINRIGRTQFGTPPWAASLRFFSAMNQLTESHVAMAQAKSAWIAKRTVKGGPSAVVTAANAVLAQTGELAASKFGEAPIGAPRTVAAPPMPGSIWTENESSKLENLNLTSGAGEAATTAQIVRAPIAAAAGFGQHYLGDASNANLATATSLELPALMNVQSWQETFEQMFRWFVDLVIQEGVRAGRLGGLAERPALEEAEGSAERLPLSKLRLAEADERAEMEARTGKDLTYTFEMPYPGRRNLPDVVTAVTSLAQSYDPAGVNVPLRRELLYFFARDGLGVDDPKRWVEEILPKDAKMLPGAGIPLGLDAEGKPLPTPPGEPTGGPTGAKGPSDAKSQYGERTANPATRTGAMAAGLIEGLSDEELLGIERALDGEWERDVVSPAVAASLAASSNGDGSA